MEKETRQFHGASIEVEFEYSSENENLKQYSKDFWDDAKIFCIVKIILRDEYSTYYGSGNTQTENKEIASYQEAIKDLEEKLIDVANGRDVKCAQKYLDDIKLDQQVAIEILESK